MKTVPSAAIPDGLERAFADFQQMAERVQAAYERLRETASRLDRDLADANLRLRLQVEELENLSGSLAAVLRAIPSGVVVADLEGRILMVNPAAERILGIRSDEVLGKPAAQVEDRRGAPLFALQEGPGEVEERWLDTAAGPRRLAGRVVEVRDGDGQALGLVEVFDDCSKIRALEDEVRRLDRLAELGRVAAIIAHEIRNPLSGIRGFAGLLQRRARERGDAASLRWLERVFEGVERADRIIDSVLFLSRPRPLDTADVDPAGLLRRVVETTARERGVPEGVRIRLETDRAPRTVRADALRLEQALGNLLRNALEAVGERGEIVVFARSVGEEILLGVEDDGPGVPEEVRDRLFEPFFTTRTEGAGLGLALVRRIAELHGGSARHETPRRGGARFLVALPAQRRSMEAAR